MTRDILFGTVPQYKVPGSVYNVCGHAEGMLIGGNLSSFSTLAGTRFIQNGNQDLILFIDEMEESLHDIDRLFYMLRLQEGFERLRVSS